MKLNMAKPLLGLICSLQIFACASGETVALRDRFGIMAIDIPTTWNDDTSNHLNNIESVKETTNTAPPSGIRTLLMIRAENHCGVCRFREFRFLPKHKGYHYGMDRLTLEIAQTNNRVLQTHGLGDYLWAGNSVPLLQLKAKRSELESSKGTKFNGHDGWQATYKQWDVKSISSEDYARSITFVIKSAAEPLNKEPKYYIVGECSFGCIAMPETGDEISAMINTIRFGRATPASEKK